MSDKLVDKIINIPQFKGAVRKFMVGPLLREANIHNFSSSRQMMIKGRRKVQ